MLHRLKNLINYVEVFPSMHDIQSFRRIAYRDRNEAVEVRLRAARGTTVRIRPGTSDAAVLWDTFHEKFHLPPSPLKANATILDLGANVGYTALHFAKLYPQALVLAVELDARNCEAAAINLRSQPRCRLIHGAVWSEDGAVAYNPNEEAWAFHVDSNTAGSNLATVPARTVSSLMAEHGLSHIDYVKMDIEGAEWPVLSSGASWLAKTAMLKVELHPKFNKHATYENCATVLRQYGFACRKDDKHWDTLIAVRS
jgi:FkbM family methyltransferase